MTPTRPSNRPAQARSFRPASSFLFRTLQFWAITPRATIFTPYTQQLTPIPPGFLISAMYPEGRMTSSPSNLHCSEAPYAPGAIASRPGSSCTNPTFPERTHPSHFRTIDYHEGRPQNPVRGRRLPISMPRVINKCPGTPAGQPPVCKTNLVPFSNVPSGRRPRQASLTRRSGLSSLQVGGNALRGPQPQESKPTSRSSASFCQNPQAAIRNPGPKIPAARLKIRKTPSGQTPVRPAKMQ